MWRWIEIAHAVNCKTTNCYNYDYDTNLIMKQKEKQFHNINKNNLGWKFSFNILYYSILYTIYASSWATNTVSYYFFILLEIISGEGYMFEWKVVIYSEVQNIETLKKKFLDSELHKNFNFSKISIFFRVSRFWTSVKKHKKNTKKTQKKHKPLECFFCIFFVFFLCFFTVKFRI